MLNFCAVHQIQPMVEVFPFKQVNEAIAKVAAGQVLFRGVLQNTKGA